ncbi:MAG: GGDEF domain-containing protein [Pseudomonadota bacterium]
MYQAAVKATGQSVSGINGDEVAARAIGFAQKYGTPLSPPIYEVWYTYSERTNPTVNEVLDTAMNTGQPMSEGFLTALYEEHLSPRAMSDELNSIGSNLTDTLGNVSDAMEENLKEHSIFSGTLRTARQSLAHGTSKREVGEVIKQLHRANQQHLAAAQRLNTQLEKNRTHVSKLKSELIEAKKNSNTDYLTGLPNRRQLDEDLAAAIFQARQRKQDLTVLMCQIDSLSAVSENWGLSAGDSVMRGFADLLAKELRSEQIAARFAGAKFAIVLPALRVAEAFTLAEQIRRRFKTFDWVAKQSGSKIGVLSVSFGGTALTMEDSRESLMDRADKMLREAMGEGADRSRIA